MTRTIGVLTAGGDSPGLNAAIRAVGKSAQRAHGMEVVGFLDGFLGLAQRRFVRLHSEDLSGIITRGGTVLGTSRAKVHKMDMGDGDTRDMRQEIARVVEDMQLEAVVCLGGDGTVKNAYKLSEAGVPILTLPKTIDNDVAETDVTFGFDTALGIATEAIDRVHSTAHSHHRIMVVEVMGHKVGWLALGAGLAAGADVILIPEIPYDIEMVASSIEERKAGGSTFSIVAVAEGAISRQDASRRERLLSEIGEESGKRKQELKQRLRGLDQTRVGGTNTLASRLTELTGLESRITILGHVQRGGTPSPADRLLATQLGAAATDFVADGVHGVLVAARDGEAKAVPLKKVAGRIKHVPLDHPWVTSTRALGISLGD
jgi:6-phosphofructokinase